MFTMVYVVLQIHARDAERFAKLRDYRGMGVHHIKINITGIKQPAEFRAQPDGCQIACWNDSSKADLALFVFDVQDAIFQLTLKFHKMFSLRAKVFRTHPLSFTAFFLSVNKLRLKNTIQDIGINTFRKRPVCEKALTFR